MTGPLIRRPPGTIPRADDYLWRGGFSFRSDSGNEYTIAYSLPGGFWLCSCPGAIHRGHCRHLAQYGRAPTRADAMAARTAAERREWGGGKAPPASPAPRQGTNAPGGLSGGAPASKAPQRAPGRQFRAFDPASIGLGKPPAPAPRFEPAPADALPVPARLARRITLDDEE